MFGGVSNHGLRTCSYADARRALEEASLTPKLRRKREPKNYGYSLGGEVTFVRQLSNGAIAFRLYSTDVVVWHPDNSVEIDNYGSVTTGGFASRFLPNSIHLNVAGSTISYATEAGGYAWGGNVCRGNIVRFRERAGVWLPDEDTLTAMRFPKIDTAKARAITKSFPFKDFETWLSMAPMHLNLEHVTEDLTTCSDALIDRDFRRVAKHLPLVSSKRSFGRNILPLKVHTQLWDRVVALSSVRKLKLALWVLGGAVTTTTIKTLTTREYARHMARLRELEGLGFYKFGETW